LDKANHKATMTSINTWLSNKWHTIQLAEECLVAWLVLPI
jgi:hypothetical protein